MFPKISAAQLFEKLAADTWGRMEAGIELDCSQGEETITDINLLELKRARLHNIRVSLKADKHLESVTGIDWEWWIGSNHKGWWRYAVQAKKINELERYSSLRHKVNGEYQIHLLKKYAISRGCIQLYCFYNFIKSKSIQDCWNCNLPYDEVQLGCTVAPIDIVEEAFYRRKPKTFKAIHSHDQVLPLYKQALPWRCLVLCPEIINLPHGESHPLARGDYAKFSAYKELPASFYQKSLTESQTGHFDADAIEFSPDFYNPDLRIYPRRILVVNIDQDPEG